VINKTSPNPFPITLAFIGQFEKGPIFKPTAITSLYKLNEIFGEKQTPDWLRVKTFFMLRPPKSIYSELIYVVRVTKDRFYDYEKAYLSIKNQGGIGEIHYPAIEEIETVRKLVNEVLNDDVILNVFSEFRVKQEEKRFKKANKSCFVIY